MGLRGKTLLVTGASGAIGSAIVRAAKLQGAWVAGTYHTHRPTPQECPADLLEAVDVRLKPSIVQWVAKSLAHNGQIDGLVTAAGNVQDRTCVKMTDAEWDDVLQTHLTGTFHSIQAVLPPMQYHRLGKIITVISQAGIHGRFGQANYAAAKGAILGLTRSVAKELGEWGIEVNAICPGFTPSRMTETAPPEAWERARSASAMGMLGDAEVLANLTLWLLSDECRGITGQIFYADSRIQ
ncbi:MAG: SDR family oxidoreductase [Candidatus Omnitrophica bacterium]|nr:SDR family oxidoreductase [Candidatus Omnitrophota bacterium]